jgi:hypothetical protein
MDWNKYIGQYPCYAVDGDFRSFNDVAACIGLIPKQIDTPVMKEIRLFLEDYDRKPTYHGSDFENNEEHIRLKDLLKGQQRKYGHYDTGELLERVKSRMSNYLESSAINLVVGCNQDIVWKQVALENGLVRHEWDDIKDSSGKPLCKVSKELVMRARDLSDAIGAEKWDIPAMTYSLKEHIFQNWIKENAWDFTADEIKSLDIDKELGLKDGKDIT